MRGKRRAEPRGCNKKSRGGSLNKLARHDSSCCSECARFFPQKSLLSEDRLLNFKNTVAGVAQLVEHFLAKEDVARSSRVTRSTFTSGLCQLSCLKFLKRRFLVADGSKEFLGMVLTIKLRRGRQVVRPSSAKALSRVRFPPPPLCRTQTRREPALSTTPHPVDVG